jgi:hypothetical protein
VCVVALLLLLLLLLLRPPKSLASKQEYNKQEVSRKTEQAFVSPFVAVTFDGIASMAMFGNFLHLLLEAGA